ncbi:DMT family transporter [Clostridium formicaceticum]|uniref:EamA-like transporter family protein n=1 Tax=Clostridium formicaceticum TaxID=1497 RepID=A0AAC9WI58_9CLOT|nr:DMT family transporter [Clostridium formicaceticum]AOY75207.1 hypothetical protein BJL90_04390 [Clostridium formicaceticum]ARE89638.1 hypothetical protein CLFO_41190 [Clostridium formicaceticum]
MVVFWGLAAFIAGGLIIISSIFNAQVATKIGAYRSALLNNVLAMITAFFLLIIIYGNFTEEVHRIKEVPLWSLGGGFLTVIIVVGSNKIIPKIPVIYTALLVFTGQLLIGLVLDSIMGRSFEVRRLTGILFILGGLVYNLYIDKKEMKE